MDFDTILYIPTLLFFPTRSIYAKKDIYVSTKKAGKQFYRIEKSEFYQYSVAFGKCLRAKEQTIGRKQVAFTLKFHFWHQNGPAQHIGNRQPTGLITQS